MDHRRGVSQSLTFFVASETDQSIDSQGKVVEGEALLARRSVKSPLAHRISLQILLMMIEPGGEILPADGSEIVAQGGALAASQLRESNLLIEVDHGSVRLSRYPSAEEIDQGCCDDVGFHSDYLLI